MVLARKHGLCSGEGIDEEDQDELFVKLEEDLEEWQDDGDTEEDEDEAE